MEQAVGLRDSSGSVDPDERTQVSERVMVLEAEKSRLGTAQGQDAVEKRPEVELLAEMVRSIYLGRKTGIIAIDRQLNSSSLYFRDGELYLAADQEISQPFREILDSHPEAASRPTADRQLERSTRDLATAMDGLQHSSFRPTASLPGNLVGPLPTVYLVMELAVQGQDEEALILRLGGEETRYRSAGNSPALHQLPGLELELTQILTRLEHPTTPSQLIRGVGTDRLAVLRQLARLRAIGLVSQVGEQAPDDSWMSAEILQRLSERVAESLENDPLDLEIDKHLRRLGELLANLRKDNHYALLGVELQADDEDIYASYNQLARQVHPSHAARLGLKGRDEALRVLFEWATEAYLTLSHPTRRFRYNMAMGFRAQVTIDDHQRQEEKRSIARQHYRRASLGLAEMDYSLAVDLLREAVRLDPQPEYFARLGQAQAKNPHWHRQALMSFKTAVNLSPQDAGIRVAFGELLEKMGRLDEARSQYKAAVEAMPSHATAQQALERLGGSRLVKSTRLGGIRNLFGSSKEE